MVVLLNIQGKCAHLRAKPAHFVGNLPAIWQTLGDVLSSPTIPVGRNLLLVRKTAEGLLEECHEIGRSVYQDFLTISQAEADRLLEHVSPGE